MIGSEDLSQLSKLARLRESEIRLFQCFLDTRLMQCRPEDPNTLRLDEEVLELGPGGRLRRKQPRGRHKMVDPLHELFHPTDPTTIGALVSVSHTFMHRILMRMCQYRAQCFSPFILPQYLDTKVY